MKVVDIKNEDDVRVYLTNTKGYAHIMRYDSFSYVRDVLFDHTSYLPDTASIKLRVSFFLGKRTEIPKCPVCSRDCFPLAGRDEFSETCNDDECSAINRRNKAIRTSQERYGVDFPNQNKEVYQKVKDTNMTRYGVESVLDIPKNRKNSNKLIQSPEVVAKRLESVRSMWDERKDQQLSSMRKGMIDKYGVEYAGHSPEIMAKVKQTNIDNHGDWFLSSEEGKQSRVDAFGAENYFQTEQFKQDNKKYNLIKHGVKHHLQHPTMFNGLTNREWLLSQYQVRSIVSIADELDTTPTTVWRYLNEYGVETSIHSNNKQSLSELEIVDYINSLGFECDENIRSVISPYEIDIFIPAKNIGIEFNGVYWHCSKFKERDYHQNKSLMCRDRGIQLIHIWSDDWSDPLKREVIKRKIKHKLGLSSRCFARKCKIIIPTTKEVRSLYEAHHIQGFIRATKHIGLEFEGELVACGSFHKNKDGYWDLNRYAASKSVVGGFSKIFKHFIRSTPECSTVYTYAHLDYSHGNLYEATGFEFKYMTTSGMFYTKGVVRERREKYMKRNLVNLLENYDESLTERENMLNHGYYQLFDSGSLRYEMKI